MNNNIHRHPVETQNFASQNRPFQKPVTLKNGVYHKMTQGDHVIVDSIVFKIPQKNLQTFVEIENGKVYIINLDGERISEALERADSGTMRSAL